MSARWGRPLVVAMCTALLAGCSGNPPALTTEQAPFTPAPSTAWTDQARTATPPAPSTAPSSTTTGPAAGKAPAGRTPAPPKTAATKPPAGSGSVFRGFRLYVDPSSEAASAARDLASSDPDSAALLRKIAAQPTALWLGDWVATADLRRRVSAHAERAQAAGATPVFVAYNIPHRDCGSFSAGGAGDAAAYRAWIDAFAAGLTSPKAAVILEPDALGVMDCLSAEQKEQRYALLRYAVNKFEARPGVDVYVDAGYWVAPADMAGRLEKAGVRAARGFAINVSNFQTTADMTAYGTRVSRQLGGKPFVIDTSRNGLGSVEGDLGWCNPPGRALGERPLSSPPSPLVDALLWVKNPGGSDGECNRGEPSAGVYWPEYAVGLARRAGR